MTKCKTILASTVSSHFRYINNNDKFITLLYNIDFIFYSNQIKKVVSQRKIKPNLVGFLANDDPAAKQYAEHTASSCKEIGLEFKLVKVDKNELKENIMKANMDKNVNGIMVYYPVFGNQMDYTLRNSVEHLKDIEGLGHHAVNSIYHGRSTKKILPCTPLAIIKVIYL